MSTAVQKESNPKEESVPLFNVNAFSYIRVSLHQTEDRVEPLAGTVVDPTIPRKTHTRHYRGDLLLPCPKGCSYRFWVFILEERLRTVALLHPNSPEARARPSGQLPICDQCRQKTPAIHESFDTQGKLYFHLHVEQIQEKCAGTKHGKRSHAYRVVPNSKWDEKWFNPTSNDKSEDGSVKKFRCFFSLQLSHEAPSRIVKSPYLVDIKHGKKSAASKKNCYRLNVGVKGVEGGMTMRLGIGEENSHLSQEATGSSKVGFSTLQQSVVDRLRQSRHRTVKRILDAKSGLPLLPSENAYVVARLFGDLLVEVADEGPPPLSTPALDGNAALWDMQDYHGAHSVINMSELSSNVSKESLFHFSPGEMQSDINDGDLPDVNDWSPMRFSTPALSALKIVNYNSSPEPPSSSSESAVVERNSLQGMNETFVYEIDDNSAMEPQEETPVKQVNGDSPLQWSSERRTRLAAIPSPSPKKNSAHVLSSQMTVAMDEGDLLPARRSLSTLESVLQRESKARAMLTDDTRKETMRVQGKETPLTTFPVVRQVKAFSPIYWTEEDVVEDVVPIATQQLPAKRRRSPITLEPSDMADLRAYSLTQLTVSLPEDKNSTAPTESSTSKFIPSVTTGEEPDRMVLDHEEIAWEDEPEEGNESSVKRTKEDDLFSLSDVSLSAEERDTPFVLTTQQTLPEYISLGDSENDEDD
ncbi:hypothetical protein AGDE_15407 [Angomonas deanei]|nr:hypothetical protein AGDE_15407 [Angomonas deanei]|eukprot:EPY19138.1 hypothetical protein AGDE_15407 [Angomonas deanei]